MVEALCSKATDEMEVVCHIDIFAFLSSAIKVAWCLLVSGALKIVS